MLDIFVDHGYQYDCQQELTDMSDWSTQSTLYAIENQLAEQNARQARVEAEYYRANGIIPPTPPKLGMIAQIARFTMFAFLILTALFIFLPVIVHVGG
jgi:hypothetical protein